MKEIFGKRNNVYYFRNPYQFARQNVRSVFNGTGNISVLGVKIWDIVLSELKQLETVNAFKRQIRKWKPEDGPCRLYIENGGFL